MLLLPGFCQIFDARLPIVYTFPLQLAIITGLSLADIKQKTDMLQAYQFYQASTVIP